MKRLFGKSQPNLPEVAGDIACLGLTTWWAKAFTDTERATIRSKYRPMGTDPGYALDRGTTTCEWNRAAKFLSGLATWFRTREMARYELAILTEAERRADYVMDQHFIFMQLGDHWYRCRDSDPSACDRAISYYKKQIALSKAAAAEWKRGDRDLVRMARKYGTSPPKFDGRMPSHTGFKQLAIIYEKDGHFAEAIQLCKQAKKDGWTGDWDKRLARIEGKAAKD